MSADNGIYIGRFITKGKISGAYEGLDSKYEYRVIHAQAIENCDRDIHTPSKVTDAIRVSYYDTSPIFHSPEEAWKDANRLSAKELILEYGVSEIHYDEPFPTLTNEEAEVVITEYYNKKDEESQKKREKEVAVKCLVTKGMFSHEYFVMVQDHPSLTPVVWRGWVDKRLVRINTNAGTTMEGYHLGVIHAHKVKEVREVRYNTTAMQYLIEFPDGIPSRRVWVEPRLVEGTW